MMRNCLLVLTFVSLAAWSQPAQQQAQPPIPVKIEMPAENLWAALLKIVLPTILGAGLGAGITLYGIRQNNKHNAVESAANREHQLKVEIAKAEIAAKYKSQDNRWEFRKGVYVNLLDATTQLIRFYANYRLTNANGLVLETTDAEAAHQAERERLEQWKHLSSINDNMMYLFYLAILATADKVFPALTTTTKDLLTAPDPHLMDTEALTRKIAAYSAFRDLLCKAGRKDLWPELEAKADTNKQG